MSPHQAESRGAGVGEGRPAAGAGLRARAGTRGPGPRGICRETSAVWVPRAPASRLTPGLGQRQPPSTPHSPHQPAPAPLCSGPACDGEPPSGGEASSAQRQLQHPGSPPPAPQVGACLRPGGDRVFWDRRGRALALLQHITSRTGPWRLGPRTERTRKPAFGQAGEGAWELAVEVPQPRAQKPARRPQKEAQG